MSEVPQITELEAFYLKSFYLSKHPKAFHIAALKYQDKLMLTATSNDLFSVNTVHCSNLILITLFFVRWIPLSFNG